ncbi:hypothetical protein Baya_1722 [Bagarius yarrelli]|uniref:Uncharacterized protein n=1 Tax=Bagarius yarrelli TaxID=175774 RepID=A0A556TLY1_BAGYA|nr:hypothetical protein Baya_1722 [Bagarius yarrelli]
MALASEERLDSLPCCESRSEMLKKLAGFLLEMPWACCSACFGPGVFWGKIGSVAKSQDDQYCNFLPGLPSQTQIRIMTSAAFVSYLRPANSHFVTLERQSLVVASP